MNIQESLQKQISESEYFLIPDDDVRKKQARMHLLELIYQYKLAESSENIEYGLEITETFAACINYYDAAKGDFLHYFNYSFARIKQKAKAKNTVQTQSSGIHYTEAELQLSGKIHQYLQTHPHISCDKLLSQLQQYTKVFDIPIEQLKHGIQLYQSSHSVSGDALVGDEEKTVLFDLISDNSDFTIKIEQEEMVRHLIHACDVCFQRARSKTQPLLSLKLTIIYAENDASGAYYDMLKETSFFNQRVYHLVSIQEKKILNRDIGQLLGLSEANLSQIWKRFTMTVKNYMDSESEGKERLF